MVYNDIQFNLIVTTEGTFKIRMKNENAEKTVWKQYMRKIRCMHLMNETKREGVQLYALGTCT